MVISIIIWRFYIWPLDGPKGSCTNPLLQLWSDLYRCTVHLTTLRCSPATYWFGGCALCHKDAIKCLWLFYMIFFSCSINHWRRVLRCQYYSTNSARNCVKTVLLRIFHIHLHPPVFFTSIFFFFSIRSLNLWRRSDLSVFLYRVWQIFGWKSQSCGAPAVPAVVFTGHQPLWVLTCT